MNRRILPLLAIAVCVLIASCKREAAPGPDVWAVVNGKPILRADVERAYRSRVNADAPDPSHEEALSLQINILDELVNSEILLERASEMNLVATDADVEEKFTESKSPYTEEEFQNKLKETGLTMDDLKNEIRRELSIQKLLNREVLAKISITDKDISDFYNQNRAQFNVAEPQYRIAQIVVTPRPDPSVQNRKNDKATTETEARQKAGILEQKLKAGADFSAARNRLFRGHELFDRRRSRFYSRVRAQPVGSRAEENGAHDEGWGVHCAYPGEGGRLSHFETARKRGGRPTRNFRSTGAARHSRHAAQPQGAASAGGISGRTARRSPHHELHGEAGAGIRG